MIVARIAVVSAFCLSAGPALAGAVAVVEPESISIFAAAIAVAVIAGRFIRRG